jgi:16S rRNA processing protein RimM
VVIGRLGRPHGVQGWNRVQPTGATLATLRPGDPVTLIGDGGSWSPAAVDALAADGAHPRIRLEGVADRDAAAALAGRWLAVARERVIVPADPDTHLVSDLVGCVVRAGSRELGRVRAVLPAPANDVLEVDAAAGPVLIPFTADAVVELDTDAGSIAIRPDLLEE